MPNYRQFTDQFGHVLNPGTLRHQITWRRKSTTTQDSFGADTEAYSDVVTCRADVRHLQGRELEMAAQMWADARYKIVQHHYAGLLPTDQIYWYNDGVARTLDVIDIWSEALGARNTQVVYAKDHIE